MKRIVYTLAMGGDKFQRCALGLGRSLRLIGDTTHRVIVTDRPDYPWKPAFDEVLPIVEPREWIFMSKLSALERTDADQVIFIDADSLAFKRLDPIFEYCQGNGLTVSGHRISSGTWYGSVEEHRKTYGVESMPQFNGGFIYYERTPECQEFIHRCYELARTATEFMEARDDGLIPDEPIISLAMAQTGSGHLAPDEMDFSNTAVGLIGPLHMDVLTNTCEFVCRRYSVRFVRPYIFHAARYIYFSVYWRQLAALERLEEFEQGHTYGYMPPGAKFRRSIEKRYLKLTGKL
ncbi:MAG: hypothetical protein ACAH95_09195 [Fimbriimonas sp.]